LFFWVIVLCLAASAHSQASYAVHIRGVVSDQTRAVVVNATVTITNNATNISQVSYSVHHGQYFFAGLRPAVHTGGHAGQLSVWRTA